MNIFCIADQRFIPAAPSGAPWALNLSFLAVQSAFQLVLKLICHCWSRSKPRSGFTPLLFVEMVLAIFLSGKIKILLLSFLLSLSLLLLKVRRTAKKIPVPDGIWTHDPPWSSRMLKLLSYWRFYGEQGSFYGSRLEQHHAATQPSNGWHTRTHWQHRAVTLKHIKVQPTNIESEYIKDLTTTTTGTRIFSEFSLPLISCSMMLKTAKHCEKSY